MTATLRALAPAKINLCLLVGPTRADGRHELVTAMESVDLCDEVTLSAGDGADAVHCPGVEGPNLAADALAAFRAQTGWDGPPVRLDILKRIPVAAGMAGGSADAAAALRLAAAAAGVGDEDLLERIATGLGADVPSQVRGGPVLATGAGERLQVLPAPAALHVLVLPVAAELSTARVYAEADHMGLARGADELAAAHDEVRAALDAGGLLGAGLVHNDLQDAARSLCPAIDEALAALGRQGADRVIVAGSGPTTLGLFADGGAAAAAGAALADREPAPVLAVTVPAGHGRVLREGAA